LSIGTGALRLLCAASLAVCAPACREAAPARAAAGEAAVSAVDDVGRKVELAHPARRVVSLLPAATETLAELGALDRVVGRTRYDTEPRFAHLPSVGGGLDPNLESIVSLKPDLVVAWESPSGSKVRERLESLGIPVFAVATRDTAAIFRTISSLGRLVGRRAAADSITRHIHQQLDSVRASVPPGPRPTVLYVVSLDPPMIAGLDNFIAELLLVAGGDPVSISGDRKGISPQVSLEELVRRQPDLVILPVGQDPMVTRRRVDREPGWRDLEAVRSGRVAEVPSDLVSRPGTTIGEMAKVLREAIRTHPVAR
jgi:iron complex transport system substrate-binding protein